MRLQFLAVPILALAAVAAATWSTPVEQSTANAAGAQRAATDAPKPAALGDLQFVENRGQWRDDVRFAALGDTTGWLHDDGFTLRLERWSAPDDDTSNARRHRSCVGGVVRTRFVDARAASFAAGEPLVTRHNFLVGERSRWRSDVPAYASVTARALLPGVDVRYRALPAGDASRGGAFEYDLLLAPGADLGAFVAECEGVERLRIDDDGRLVADVVTPAGTFELVQQAPIAWQQTPAGARPLPVSFRLLGARRYGFVAEGRDASLPTVVDPGVVWGNLLGGGATDRVNAVQWTPGAPIWVAGWTGSTDFPVSAGAFQVTGGNDGFLARLSENGQELLFATYLGGSEGDVIRGLALAPGGTPTVVGFTNSADFPTTPGAAQPNYAGGDAFVNIGDAFVTRLNASGSALLGSTYLGGIFDDIAEDVVTDATGNAFVVGWTTSFDFPTTAGVVQPGIGGLAIVQSDGFVAKVSAIGTSVDWSTYYGGEISEQFLAVDRDAASGELLVSGWTYSDDYPTTAGAAQAEIAGDIDVVVTRLAADGSAAVFSTYLGGIGEDVAMDVRVLADGTVWTCGATTSDDFDLTPDAVQSVRAGANDGFVTALAADGASVVYSTLLGGQDQDRARALSVSDEGVLVVGEAGRSFPTTADAAQTAFAGGQLDAFATLLSDGGSTLRWSSYFGGAGQDAFGDVLFAPSGLAVVVGWSYSPDFPIAPAGFGATLVGAESGVVMQLDTVDVLGAALEVLPSSTDDVVTIEGGDQELLAFDVRNFSDRKLELEELDVFVAASAVLPGLVTQLRLLNGGVVVDERAAPLLNRESSLSFDDFELAPGAQASFRVVAALAPSANGRTVEVAAAILGVDSWQVEAEGAGAGPDVFVLPAARVVGPVFVLGALVADIDGDGERTAFDVRRLVTTIGAPEVAVDVDGDDVTTAADAAACAQAVLGRATLLPPPTPFVRGSWLPLRGLLPDRASVQVTLGGRDLVVGRVMPRQLVVRVEADQPTGAQELLVTVDGRVLFQGVVEVL